MFQTEDHSVPTSLTSFVVKDVIVLDGTSGPLTAEQENDLRSFVAQGGGLICTGEAVEMYHEAELLSEVIGPVYGACTPSTEIIARPANTTHYLLRRVDPSFIITEALYLLEYIPPDADILWQTMWRYTPRTLAYVRQYGQGRVFCTVLGTTPETRAHPIFQQMLARAIRYVKREDAPERPIRTAMIGYGAIGFEHGTAINAVAGLEYTLVCDRNEARLALAQQAFPNVRTCTDVMQVAENPDIDLVIISTPPNTHAALSMQMLQAGKHVVSEKPFCITAAEADDMIQIAQEHQRALTVYQCRRWDPDYLAIQQVMQQGLIGSIFHMETFIGDYAHPCDYWHSHEPISGGVFYDWGSHYIDWILQLIAGRVVNVRGAEHKRVWHDVTNADQSTVSLTFEDGQEATFMHSDIAAALKPKWYILGERGAIVGNWRRETVKSRRWSGDLIEERLAPSEALPDLTVYARDVGGAIHEQRLMLPVTPLYPFHRNLANHLHCGEALAVPPAESRRNIVVMEAASYSAKHGGACVTVDC